MLKRIYLIGCLETNIEKILVKNRKSVIILKEFMFFNLEFTVDINSFRQLIEKSVL